MPLRFNQPSKRPSGSVRMPPPNYSSRWVQARLLLLVSALMLVIVAMFEAGDPKYYKWIGFNESGGLNENETAAGNIDTRLVPPEHRRKSALRSGEIRFAGDKSNVFDAKQPLGDDVGGQRREVLEGWAELLRGLDRQDRDLLYLVLHSARYRKAVEIENLSRWPQLLSQLDDGWESYVSQVRQVVQQMSNEQDKAAWQQILKRLRSFWTETRNALHCYGLGTPLSDEQHQQLASLQALLDEIALRSVEDNTVLSRPQEHDAWFRLLDVLNNSSAAELRGKSEGRVGFLQLFKQPRRFRGKLVTIRGTARLGYHVRSPRNIFGIEGYYVFIVQPAGGPNAPIFVYSLEMPADFPRLQDKNAEHATTLCEEVEFTGFFYKNHAYRAQDTTRLAPLMLAKVPAWTPPRSAQEMAQLPTRETMYLGLFGIACVAGLISALVYVQSRTTSRVVAQYMSTRQVNPADLATLTRLSSASVEQSLRQLAESVRIDHETQPDDPCE